MISKLVLICVLFLVAVTIVFVTVKHCEKYVLLRNVGKFPLLCRKYSENEQNETESEDDNAEYDEYLENKRDNSNFVGGGFYRNYRTRR